MRVYLEEDRERDTGEETLLEGSGEEDMRTLRREGELNTTPSSMQGEL